MILKIKNESKGISESYTYIENCSDVTTEKIRLKKIFETMYGGVDYTPEGKTVYREYLQSYAQKKSKEEKVVYDFVLIEPIKEAISFISDEFNFESKCNNLGVLSKLSELVLGNTHIEDFDSWINNTFLDIISFTKDDEIQCVINFDNQIYLLNDDGKTIDIIR